MPELKIIQSMEEIKEDERELEFTHDEINNTDFEKETEPTHITLEAPVEPQEVDHSNFDKECKSEDPKEIEQINHSPRAKSEKEILGKGLIEQEVETSFTVSAPESINESVISTPSQREMKGPHTFKNGSTYEG